MKEHIVIHQLCIFHDKVLEQYLASNHKRCLKQKFLSFLCLRLMPFDFMAVSYLILRKLKSLSILKYTLLEIKVFRKFRAVLILNITLDMMMKMEIIRWFMATILVIDMRLSNFLGKEVSVLLCSVQTTKQKKKQHLSQ